jgi:sec-independent protein translocase protein TatB
VGPRDLPTLLRTVGKVAGQARRMGNDFRRELNKVAAIDEVNDIKKSLTQPLRDTGSSINREFNKITDKGVEPTGSLKPTDPDAESVYDEIKSATEGTTATKSTLDAGRETMSEVFAAVKARKQADAEQAAALAEATKPVAAKPPARKSAAKKPAAKKPAAAKPAPAKATAAKATAAKATAAKSKTVKKPATRKAAARPAADKVKSATTDSKKA